MKDTFNIRNALSSFSSFVILIVFFLFYFFKRRYKLADVSCCFIMDF